MIATRVFNHIAAVDNQHPMPGTLYRTVSCMHMCGTRIVRVYMKVNSTALNCQIFSQLTHQFFIAVFIAATKLTIAARVGCACANVEM